MHQKCFTIIIIILSVWIQTSVIILVRIVNQVTKLGSISKTARGLLLLVGLCGCLWIKKEGTLKTFACWKNLRKKYLQKTAKRVKDPLWYHDKKFHGIDTFIINLPLYFVRCFVDMKGNSFSYLCKPILFWILQVYCKISKLKESLWPSYWL